MKTFIVKVVTCFNTKKKKGRKKKKGEKKKKEEIRRKISNHPETHNHTTFVDGDQVRAKSLESTN